MRKAALIFGACFCLMAVLLGAFGAHALADLLVINAREEVYELANRYQFYHGLGLMLVGVIAEQRRLNGALFTRLVWCMVVGVLVFCGSLYLLALTNVGWLGAITPIGGVCLIAAWAMFIRVIMDNS